jgi:hypothetical protein
MLRDDQPSLTADRGTFEGIAQLANGARPVVDEPMCRWLSWCHANVCWAFQQRQRAAPGA